MVFWMDLGLGCVLDCGFGFFLGWWGLIGVVGIGSGVLGGSGVRLGGVNDAKAVFFYQRAIVPVTHGVV